MLQYLVDVNTGGTVGPGDGGGGCGGNGGGGSLLRPWRWSLLGRTTGG